MLSERHVLVNTWLAEQRPYKLSAFINILTKKETHVFEHNFSLMFCGTIDITTEIIHEGCKSCVCECVLRTKTAISVK